MQIEVHDVDPEVARAGVSEDRVEVRAVVVDKAASFVHDIDDFLNVLVPEPERVRVGDHQSGGLRSDFAAERLDIDIAAMRPMES